MSLQKIRKFNSYTILSPHVDDFAFSLGASLLSSYFNNVKIISIFTVSSCTAKNENSDIDFVTSIRKKEDSYFSEMCPIDLEITYLDLLDAPLRLKIKEEDVCRISNPINTLRTQNEIKQKIKNSVSDDSLILSPLGIGNHIDHLIVRDLAFTLIKNGLKVAFYEDLPYAGSFSIFEITNYLKSLSEKNNIELKPYIINTNISIEKKKEACSKYASQIEESTKNRISLYHNELGFQTASERIWAPNL